MSCVIMEHHSTSVCESLNEPSSLHVVSVVGAESLAVNEAVKRIQWPRRRVEKVFLRRKCALHRLRYQ